MGGIAGAVGAPFDRLSDAVRLAGDRMGHRGAQGRMVELACEAGNGIGLWVSGRRGARADTPDGALAADPATAVHAALAGALYNAGEIRRELEKAGVPDAHRGDAGVALRAYLLWGKAALDRFEGAYAVAFADPRAGQILLARDRLGVRPLYIARTSGKGVTAIMFASEVRALLATGLIPHKLDRVAFETLVWNGFVMAPNTMVADVEAVPPGTCLRIDRDRLQVDARKYWSVPSHVDGGSGIPDLRAALLEAVGRQYGDGADVGLFLSGGVDSSAVAALACDAVGGRVRTFNLAFDEVAFDESPYARKVSDVLGTEHHEIRLTAGFFERHLEDALGSLDQPSFDALNSYMVSRAVHDLGVRVALGGTGGDDLFGGNRTFVDIPKALRLGRALRLLPGPALELSARMLARWKTGVATSVPPQTRWGKLRDVAIAGGDLVHTYQVAYALFTGRFLRRLLPRHAHGVRNGMPLARITELRELVRDNSLMYSIAMLELSVFVGDRLLRDIDAASSAAGLEVRCPLLDERVLDTWRSVDEKLLFEPVFSKRALRGAALERLDPALFDRPKAGFVLPFEVWCRKSLRGVLDDTFRDREHARSLGLDPDAVLLLWQAFERGEPGLYWSRVWAIFVALWWCRNHDVHL
jgi:asparagine synthase (glutamine-hydrolysing)